MPVIRCIPESCEIDDFAGELRRNTAIARVFSTQRRAHTFVYANRSRFKIAAFRSRGIAGDARSIAADARGIRTSHPNWENFVDGDRKGIEFVQKRIEATCRILAPSSFEKRHRSPLRSSSASGQSARMTPFQLW